MGLEGLKGLKYTSLSLPSFHCKKGSGLFPARSCLVRKNQSLELGYQLNPFGHWKRACSSSSLNEFFGDEMEDAKGRTYMSFVPSKLEFLEPNSLGIKPDPPEWLEKDKIAMISIERKANRVEIPLSLRMIKRKQQRNCNYNFSVCSAKKAFSYMVFMLRELQAHAFQLRERLYSEDWQVVSSRVQFEMNASFVWLFQQVFSRTPTLMVYVILLVANFTVHSVACHSQIDTKATALPSAFRETVPEASTVSEDPGSVDVVVVPIEEDQVQVLGDDEMVVWKSMVEEASRMSSFEVLDSETLNRMVSSVKVELEPDNYDEYFRTDLIYQMAVAEDPFNPLLLSNYAQFLYLVPRDYDRAEECFKRATMVEPQDAESLTRYADFLWLVRKDLWGAEERYQQAIAAEPNSHYHASKYAAFLWSTGGDETCFPLSNPSNDSYDKVM